MPRVRLPGRDPTSPPASTTAVAPQDEFPDLVTLAQIAALVRRSKRTLQGYLLKRGMPAPDVPAPTRGMPHLWIYQKIRPWLEARFRIPLPKRFPGSPFNF